VLFNINNFKAFKSYKMRRRGNDKLKHSLSRSQTATIINQHILSLIHFDSNTNSHSFLLYSMFHPAASNSVDIASVNSFWIYLPSSRILTVSDGEIDCIEFNNDLKRNLHRSSNVLMFTVSTDGNRESHSGLNTLFVVLAISSDINSIDHWDFFCLRAHLKW